MARKIREANAILQRGEFNLPSPAEIEAAGTPAGYAGCFAWKAVTLASWGVPYPPPKGWKTELERKWREANPDVKENARDVERR